MDLLKDLRDLFIPKRCLHCKQILSSNYKHLCITCSLQIEQTNTITTSNNSVEKILWGKINFIEAGALYTYYKNSPIQTLLKALKYHNYQEIGIEVGETIIHELKKTNRFKNIDIITIVPLHPKKEKRRGYNQVELFGKTIAKHFETTFYKDLLIKKYDNKSQTIFGKEERFKSVETIFRLNSKYDITNKNILILDDVLTTGATLSACCNVLHKNQKIKISIITMACVL